MRADGSPCRAAARPSGYCWAHDPSLSARRDAARRAGGRERSRRAAVLPDAPDLALVSVADAQVIYARTLNDVRQGKLDPRVSNAIGYLLAGFVRALEGFDHEQRLAAVEEQLAQRGTRR
jgi:hypothetical protein